MQSVAVGDAGTASGVNNALSRVAGVLAIAVFGSLMAVVFEPRLHAAVTADGMPADLGLALWRQRERLAAIELPAGVAQAFAQAARAAVQDAFVAGYRWIMACSAALALCSAAVALFLLDDRKLPMSSRT
jgi:hypothetical protein